MPSDSAYHNLTRRMEALQGATWVWNEEAEKQMQAGQALWKIFLSASYAGIDRFQLLVAQPFELDWYLRVQAHRLERFKNDRYSDPLHPLRIPEQWNLRDIIREEKMKVVSTSNYVMPSGVAQFAGLLNFLEKGGMFPQLTPRSRYLDWGGLTEQGKRRC